MYSSVNRSLVKIKGWPCVTKVSEPSGGLDPGRIRRSRPALPVRGRPAALRPPDERRPGFARPRLRRSHSSGTAPFRRSCETHRTRLGAQGARRHHQPRQQRGPGAHHRACLRLPPDQRQAGGDAAPQDIKHEIVRLSDPSARMRIRKREGFSKKALGQAWGEPAGGNGQGGSWQAGRQTGDRLTARWAKSSRLRCVGGLSLATCLTSLFPRHDDCAGYLEREHTIECRRCIALTRSCSSSDRSRNEAGIRAALVAIEAIFPAPPWRERPSCLLLGRMQTHHRSKQQGTGSSLPPQA